MKRSLFLAAFATAALSLASSAHAAARVYVQIGPPAAVVEVRPVAPGPHHVWIEGYHRWDGHAYVWVGGRWALPPGAYHTWVPGHWVHHPHHGWYWVEGHWR